jgi:hypothetical protein
MSLNCVGIKSHKAKKKNKKRTAINFKYPRQLLVIIEMHIEDKTKKKTVKGTIGLFNPNAELATC